MSLTHRDNRLRLAATAAVLFAAGAATLTAGCQKKNNAKERVCSEGQALVTAKMKGAGLPPKTIALTFDDGPGWRTVELSHWLKSVGVPAAFFVNGKNMPANAGAVLQELVADGHVIGNHTQNHSDLTTLDGASVVAEVSQTDALIASFVPDQRFMFRAPYGAFNDVAFSALQGSPMSKYVGPIDWDLGNNMGPAQAADWDCWSPEGTSDPPVIDPKTCGDLYLAEIRAQRNGIVLMHDPYFINDDPAQGGTVDMVMYIVPILQAEGFTFVRVDEVPAVKAALPPLTTAAVPAAEDPAQTPGGGSTEPCPPSPQTATTNSP